MDGPFKSLLVPVQDITFRRYKLSFMPYKSVTGLFNVHKLPHHNFWSWNLTSKALSEVKFNNLWKYQQDQKGYSSWVKARDEIIELLHKTTPSVVIDKKMFQDIDHQYYFYVQERLTNIEIKKLKNKWNLLHNMYYSSCTQENIFSSLYNTRKEIVKDLHQYVSHNLYQLYINNKHTYLTERETMLNEQKNSKHKMRFNIWWMSFVPLKKELSQIFAD